MFKRICFISLLSFSMVSSVLAAPKVVVSTNPIHALVSGIMKDVGKPELVLSAKESPHHFQMTPAKAELMSQADLFIWVGPQLESILEKPSDNLISKGAKVTLINIPTLTLHSKDNGKTDPHIWLDPENAKTIVAFIAQRLGEIDPANKTKYEKNAVGLLNEIDLTCEAIKEKLKNHKGKYYFVYHDAYQYFERAFGLERGIPVVMDISGGLRSTQRAKLEKIVKEKKISCIFAEPQHGQKKVRTIADQMGLKMGVLDDIGVGTTGDVKNAYLVMMNNIADSLNSCLE